MLLISSIAFTDFLFLRLFFPFCMLQILGPGIHNVKRYYKVEKNDAINKPFTNYE